MAMMCALFGACPDERPAQIPDPCVLEQARQIEMAAENDALSDENKRLQRKVAKLRKQLQAKKAQAADEDARKEPRSFTVTATAYTAFCDTGCTGVTATGVDVSNTIYYEGMRVIAVDPDQIPLGSVVEITVGGRTFKATAQDTGGAIDYGDIDLLVASRSDAMRFGRQKAKVRIIKKITKGND